MSITQFDHVISLLDSLNIFHMDFSLDRMEKALIALRIRPSCPSVQIVGTNGKGSTATFLAQMAKEHGVKVGLYTSPHIISFTERIRINGETLDEELWVQAVQKVHSLGIDLTYFELLTLVAFVAFYEAKTDLMIFEAGLGGRHDATSMLPADVLCFTPIGKDHEHILGHSLVEIATEKAHATPFERAVFSAKQESEVAEILRSFAGERKSSFEETQSIEHLPLGLLGAHQGVNAGLAQAAFSYLCKQYIWPYDEEKVAKALKESHIVGRLQWTRFYDEVTKEEIPVLLDGAHNAHGLRALTAYIASLEAKAEPRPGAIIFSCLADKDKIEMLEIVKELAALCGDVPVFVPTILDNKRAVLAKDLAALLGEGAMPCTDIKDALQKASAHVRKEKKPVLLCGSLYLIAEYGKHYPLL